MTRVSFVLDYLCEHCTHKCLYTCTFICISICICWEPFTPYSNFSPSPRVIFSTPFSNRKTRLHHLYVFTHMTNTLSTVNILLPFSPSYMMMPPSLCLALIPLPGCLLTLWRHAASHPVWPATMLDHTLMRVLSFPLLKLLIIPSLPPPCGWPSHPMWSYVDSVTPDQVASLQIYLSCPAQTLILCLCVYINGSVMSDFVTPWTVARRLLCRWNSPSKNTIMGHYSLLQGSSPPRDQIWAFCIAGSFFTIWATKPCSVWGSSIYSDISGCLSLDQHILLLMCEYLLALLYLMI